MKKILIIDDEIGILHVIEAFFTDKDYTVLKAQDAEGALKKLSENPDIILLDITMPHIDGITFCSQIREKTLCPIVFLTAKTDEISKLRGLSAGGDDYIAKPFSVKELYARVEAHLRREQRPRETSKSIQFNGIWINYSKKEIGIDNEIIDFVKKEYLIIEFLTLHAGQVFSHERIYENVWGYDAEGNAHSAVTEHIKRIRRKFEKYNIRDVIETVWGIGYKWKK